MNKFTAESGDVTQAEKSPDARLAPPGFSNFSDL